MATIPQLRARENQGDLFQASADAPFNLAGQAGIDHEARQAAAEKEATLASYREEAAAIAQWRLL